jgi:KaiC/GvpD/RAD55 family RecA-like ATPase
MTIRPEIRSMAPRTFQPDQEWIRTVLPEGIPTGESTVVSGPGGSGKPLIGFSIVDSWLAAGGSVVMLLTNSGTEFVVETMAELYGTDLAAADDRLAWVDFDPAMEPAVEAIETVSAREVRGNLLEPAVWRETLDRSTAAVPGDSPGTLVFGSALNLFLFSPTYGDRMLEEFVDVVADESSVTSLFTVSTSAFEDRIARVEEAADTLLLTSMADGRLRLRGVRSDSVAVSTDEVDVPFTESQLQRIKSVAEETRDSIIPTIKNV